MASTSRGTKRSYGDVGDTRLHKAVRRNDLKTVEMLIKQGANVNARDENGNTPLHWAAFKKNIPVVKLLITQGADVNAQDERGITPLFLTDDLEIVKALVEKGASVFIEINNSFTSFLSKQAENGNKEIVEFLIEKKSINLDAGYPLFFSLTSKHTEIAKLLIKAGADVNLALPLKAVGNLESVEEMEEIIKLMMEKGANINAVEENPNFGGAALIAAVQSNNFEFARLLVKYGADVNITHEGDTAMHYLAHMHADEDYDKDKNDLIRIGKLLIKNGIDVNARDDEGDTALHIAASQNDLTFVTCLVEEAGNGIDVNAMDVEGKTALHIAASENDLPIATYLVEEAGADVNLRDINDNLFWHLATEQEVEDRLRSLYDQYAYDSLSISKLKGSRPAGVCLKY